MIIAVFTSCGNSPTQTSQLKRDRSAPVFENKQYPIKPDLEMTPGDLCDTPDERRYPERINYCDRDVDVELKAEIFATYDKTFDFHTREMNRQDFKIDHLVPLCLGGSNKQDNLWPQHKNVYNLTDPLEPFLCNKLSMGQIKQAEAVKIIIEVKQNPNSTDSRMEQLD